MKFPKGLNTKEGAGRTHILQLLKNQYIQNYTGCVWNHHLNDALRAIGFKQSGVKECVWYRDKTIFLYYVNDGIFMGTDPREVEKLIK